MYDLTNNELHQSNSQNRLRYGINAKRSAFACVTPVKVSYIKDSRQIAHDVGTHVLISDLIEHQTGCFPQLFLSRCNVFDRRFVSIKMCRRTVGRMEFQNVKCKAFS